MAIVIVEYKDVIKTIHKVQEEKFNLLKKMILDYFK
jgi:hypothetical protein